MSDWRETGLPHDDGPHACGSSDAVSVNEDGWATCFSCSHRWNYDEGDTVSEKKSPANKAAFIIHEPVPLMKRGLRQETLKSYRYGVGKVDGRSVQVADYFDKNGRMIGQKVRGADKNFYSIGKTDGQFFGAKSVRGSGKRITITEGEIDAMSIGQAMGGKEDVVSLPNGAAAAAKAIRANLEMLLKYDHVILAFDDDDAGQEAIETVATLLPSGKVKIMRYGGHKDGNAQLTEEGDASVRDSFWKAKDWQPEGVVNLANLRDRIMAPIAMGKPFPFEVLNSKLLGYRGGEVITLTAGTGAGKSTIVSKWLHWNSKHDIPTGILSLEEPLDMVGKRQVGMELSIPFHKPSEEWPSTPTQKQIDAAFEATVGQGHINALDQMGSLDPEVLINRMRHLIVGMGSTVVFLDHVSMIASGAGSDTDERKLMDKLYTDMKMLAQETDATIVAVSHLSRGSSQQKSSEEGGKISLKQLRGSHAIAQLSDTIIGFERNQQADDEEERKLTLIRSLKGRYSGYTGPAGALTFDENKWQLIEVADDRQSQADKAKAAFADQDF